MLNHLTIQRVPEAKTAKLRAHLDLFTRDMDSEVARLVALGATVLVPAPMQTMWADQIGAAVRDAALLPLDVLTAETASTGHHGWRRELMAAAVVSPDAAAWVAAWLRGLADRIDTPDAG